MTDSPLQRRRAASCAARRRRRSLPAAAAGGLRRSLPARPLATRHQHLMQQNHFGNSHNDAMHRIAEQILAGVNQILSEKGVMLREGTILNATCVKKGGNCRARRLATPRRNLRALELVSTNHRRGRFSTRACPTSRSWGAFWISSITKVGWGRRPGGHAAARAGRGRCAARVESE
jgi:hypothetical protein